MHVTIFNGNFVLFSVPPPLIGIGDTPLSSYNFLIVKMPNQDNSSASPLSTLHKPPLLRSCTIKNYDTSL